MRQGVGRVVVVGRREGGHRAADTAPAMVRRGGGRERVGEVRGGGDEATAAAGAGARKGQLAGGPAWGGRMRGHGPRGAAEGVEMRREGRWAVLRVGGRREGTGWRARSGVR